MTTDDRLSLTMFGKEGKDLIRKCELPGQIVINQNGGYDGFNQLGKVAFVEKKQKEDIISGITEKAVKPFSQRASSFLKEYPDSPSILLLFPECWRSHAT